MKELAFVCKSYDSELDGHHIVIVSHRSCKVNSGILDKIKQSMPDIEISSKVVAFSLLNKRYFLHRDGRIKVVTKDKGER